MPIDKAQIAKDLDAIIEDAPCEVTIAGDVFSGWKSTLRNEVKFSDFGISKKYRFTVRINNYTDPPGVEIDDLVIISGINYRVLLIDTAAITGLTLHLGEENA